jgi:PhnB protein
VFFEVGVSDVDAGYKRAVDNGAVPAMPPTDMFWGDRYGWVQNPFGHMWALCAVQEVLKPDQVEPECAGSTQMRGQES